MAFQNNKINKFIKQYKKLVGEENKTKFFECCLIDMATKSSYSTTKYIVILKCEWCGKTFTKLLKHVKNLKKSSHYCCPKCKAKASQRKMSLVRWKKGNYPILLNGDMF